MTTIANLETGVLDRVEEVNPSIFWNLPSEIRVYLVEAFNEACLITGDPQVQLSTVVTVTASTTLQAMPAGAVAVLRVAAAGGTPIRKTSVWNLDQHYPKWRNDTGATMTSWFPFGLGQWGVYPQLTAPIEVVMTVVSLPVQSARPYTGAETVPFQPEYNEAFKDYAAHVARLKEATGEFQASVQLYNRFLAKMEEMSRFATRKGSLRFSAGFGPMASPTPVRSK